MASNLEALASNLLAMASNPIGIAANLIGIAANLLALASNGKKWEEREECLCPVPRRSLLLPPRARARKGPSSLLYY